MLSLNNVELIAVSSLHHDLTLRALTESARQIRFAAVKYLTDDSILEVPDGIERIVIEPLQSATDYSHFMLKRLGDHVEADFALIVQWDGYVLNAQRWRPEFLNYDYIGAPWPQFDDEHDVGNGGFSLRSRRLVKACQDPAVQSGPREDIIICRTSRPFLEKSYGLKFAPADVANSFSFERTVPEEPTFGFHGLFNLIDILGPGKFSRLYDLADMSAVGERELRDCLVQILRRAPIRQLPLAIGLLRRWLAARKQGREIAGPA